MVKNLALLWLWHRLAAAALIQPLAGELPYAKYVKKNKYIKDRSSLVAQQGKDSMLSLQQLGSLLWHKLDLQPRNFCMLWVHLPHPPKKDMIKDTDERPDEETESEVWEGPEHRSFCPCRVGLHHPPRVGVFAHIEAVYFVFCFFASYGRTHSIWKFPG